MLFDTFKASGVAFANSALLSLLASGRTRGVVLECGGGVSHAVPVFEGFTLKHAVHRLDAAGQDVTNYLQNNFRQDLSYQTIRDMKHTLCNCSPVSGRGAVKDKASYMLPDGTSVEVDGVYTSACMDLLFNPDEYGVENLDGGLGEMVAKSIQVRKRKATAEQPHLRRNKDISHKAPPIPQLNSLGSYFIDIISKTFDVGVVVVAAVLF